MQDTEFTVYKTSKTQMGFSWMPRVNTVPKYPDPWRPGKTSVFDLTKPLKDVIGEMCVYHSRLLIAKHKAMTKMSEEFLQEYFFELQALAYERAFKGLRCWKPAYGLNMYVQNHVRFAAMTLKTRREKDADKGLGAVLVPDETVSDLSMSFSEAMSLAEAYIDQGKDSEAAAIYDKIRKTSEDTSTDVYENVNELIN